MLVLDRPLRLGACFDRAGDLLPVRFGPGEPKATFVQLAPGEEHAVLAAAPAGTSYARVAFHHRLATRNPPEGWRSVGNGTLFSAALRLDRDLGRASLK